MSDTGASDSPMWFDELPSRRSWTWLWTGYVVCSGACPGIRRTEAVCSACGDGPMRREPRVVKISGRDVFVGETFMGAEGRYEDYIYLQMLQREWERPAAAFEGLSHLSGEEGPSARAALVLLFWGYFETRIERLLRTAMRALPERVLNDELRRYSGIAARLRELYKIFFGTTYFDDLRELGYADVADLLLDVHTRRNEFAHGKPQAINDKTVERLVALLKAEHEAWIAVFNRRVGARVPDSPPGA